MDPFVFLALLQDGITTGAIYLLLAIGLLIVFSVTRVIFVPQGDLLAYGGRIRIAGDRSGGGRCRVDGLGERAGTGRQSCLVEESSHGPGMDGFSIDR